MKLFRNALAALALLWPAAFAAPALAADNVALTVGSGKNMGCKEIAVVCYSQVILVDTSAAVIYKNEDAVHTSGDAGWAVWAVRKDTAAALAGTDGDYAPFEVDANGRLHSIVVAASGAFASGSFASGSVASGAVASGAFASGSISSGAVASGAIAAGALASGAGVDGWDLTQGAKSDAAWASGSGSIVALLKTIATVALDNSTAGLVKFSQTSTDNDVDVVSSALPTGAATSAKQDALAALFPSSIGSKARASSLGVALSTEDQTVQSAVKTATEAIQAAMSTALPAGTNIVGKFGIDQTTPGTTNGVQVNAALPAGTNVVGYTSTAFDVATTITRPANTTAYTAGDVLGGALDLGVLGNSGSTIEITSVQLEADIAAVPAGQTTWVLYLYSVTPPSATADNGAFDVPSGDRASFLGSVALSALADLGSTLYVETTFSVPKQLKLSGTHLFGYLQTVGGFTPAANSEVYKLTVHTRVR